VESSLTYIFGKICLIKNDSNAVRVYIDYMRRNENSAEEQISFSFEYLFVKQPEFILSNCIHNDWLLDHLAWGFMNNRYYGVQDPYEDNPNKAFTVYYNPPKPVLNDKNCKEIFYKVNPSLIKLYPKYKKQVDYLLNTISEGLKEKTGK